MESFIGTCEDMNRRFFVISLNNDNGLRTFPLVKFGIIREIYEITCKH